MAGSIADSLEWHAGCGIPGLRFSDSINSNGRIRFSPPQPDIVYHFYRNPFYTGIAGTQPEAADTHIKNRSK